MKIVLNVIKMCIRDRGDGTAVYLGDPPDEDAANAGALILRTAARQQPSRGEQAGAETLHIATPTFAQTLQAIA